MSQIILCRTKQAEKPYFLQDLGINIYSLEELCYYIYTHIYIITNEFISDDLISFIRNETKQEQLADQLDRLRSQKAGLAEMLVTILKYVDYYNVGEIEQIRDILRTLSTQNVYERMKSRADSFLGNKCYYSAIKNYTAIIEGAPDPELSGLFYAKVYHNLGVAYAKVFLYRQAADFFMQAYKIGQHAESLKCYMAALRLSKGEDVIENLDDDVDESEKAVRKELGSCRDNARYSDEYRRLQDIEGLKEKGKISEYYKAIDECMQVWKEQYARYTS
jgi:tetratricopeptide (TPR) repeat protein